MSNFKKFFLKDISNSQTGPFGTQLHKEDYVSDGTPIVTVEHLGEISFNLENLPMVSDKDKERLSKYVLKEGDIVFSRVGSVDRCTYVSKKEDGWLFSGRCIRVRVNEKADARYVSFYFRQKYFKEMMRNISVGAIMSSLNTSLMDNLPIFLPSKIIQQKIAAVLSSLDSKIALNNRINTELEAMAKTLYDYWFVQFDFSDTNGKPYKTSGGKMVYNAALKREIPEGWSADIVGNVLGKTPASNKVLNQEILLTGSIPVIDQSKDYICGFTDDKSALIKPTQPHIVFGDHTRIVKLVNFEYARGADGTQVLISNNKRMPGYLLYQTVAGIDLSNYGYARHFKFLKDSMIVIPNDAIAARYHGAVTPWFEKIKEGVFENQQLMLFRDWLLPMLMNGQVTVTQ
jgi:type I restriction enzyme, S subunit